VVVSIIGVLSTIVLGSLNDARTRAKDSARLAEAQALQKALELYYLDNNEYPQIPTASLSLGYRFVATCFPAGSSLDFTLLSNDLEQYGYTRKSQEDDPCIWYINGAYNPSSSPARCDRYPTAGYTLLLDTELSRFDSFELFSDSISGVEYRLCIQGGY